MRPLKKIIDLAALRHNWQTLQAQAPKAQLMAVVKANAYGHDSLTIAKALADVAPCYAVACIEEALELRKAGIVQPIVLLEGIFSADEVALCAEQGFQPVIHHQRQLKWLASAQVALKAWLKIDSGMHRLGFMPHEISAIFAQAQAIPMMTWQGVVSHFACADSEDLSHAQAQIAVLQALSLPAHWQRSYANSATLFRLPQMHGDWVRAGIMLYGLSPFEHSHAAQFGLRPVMQLQTEILATRYVQAGESAGYGQGFVASEAGYLATIALGYGDGFPRRIESAQVPVLIHDKRFMLVGRVAMDMALVWLGAKDYPAGTAVEIFGKRLPAEIVAQAAGTIPYTLTTMLTPRVHLEVQHG